MRRGCPVVARHKGTGVKIPRLENKEQLIALAAELERRAVQRFRLMAERARAERCDELAQLFERLAKEEERHLEHVKALGTPDRGVQKADDDAWLQSVIPVSGESNATEIGRLTLYGCLAEAVRNEEKAFAFFSHLAGESIHPSVKVLAEHLAKEELQHAHLLRKARRKAYRLPASGTAFWPKTVEAKTLQDLISTAVECEAAYLGYLTGLPLPAEVMPAILELLRQALPEHDWHPETKRKASSSQPNDAKSQISNALRGAEESFAFYDTALTQAANHETMLRAQALSEMALTRLKLLCKALEE